ncbi:MAG: hypothetical protein ABII00_10320 [Elusimicrobiota bacterium]
MKKILAAFLAFALAPGSSLWASSIRVQTPVQGGSSVAGQAGALSGSGTGTSANPSLNTPGPSLIPVIKAPLSSPKPVVPDRGVPAAASGILEPAASAAAPLVRPVDRSLALPAALHGVPAGGDAAPAAAQDSRAARHAAGQPGARAFASRIGKVPRKAAGAQESSPESAARAGRIAFDGAAAAKTIETAPAVKARPFSLGGLVRSLLKRPDIVPESIGREGDKVRVDGQTYALGRRLSEERGSARYAEPWSSYLTFRVMEPGAAGSFDAELAALRELAGTGIPHAELYKMSADGRVVIQRYFDGWSFAESREKGWGARYTNSLADLAARLILIGRTADLTESNLHWSKWSAQWVLMRAASFRRGTASDVLSQIIGTDLPERAGFSRTAFLSALRGRLGPDSASWRRVLKEAESVPKLKKDMDALARRDAARPPPAKLRFSRAQDDPALDNSLVKPRELRKRLGYDPLSASPRTMLHTDDPGKLNTEVFSIEPKSGPSRVVKIAEARIIQNELFLRKVIQRFFGAYFETPRSAAVLNGQESYMVMEHAEGSRGWGQTPMSAAQRVALAVLMHTFGVSDVNPGNVLYSGERVILIDFEHVFGRATPNLSRIGDVTILWELPWVNGSDLLIEDFVDGIRAWRELMAEPDAKRELETMMAESGFSEDEIAENAETVRLNLDDLNWTILTDVEFAEGFSRK